MQPPLKRSVGSSVCALLLASTLQAAEPAAEPPAPATDPDAVPVFAGRRDAAVGAALSRLGLSSDIEPVRLEDTAFLALMKPPRPPQKPVGSVLLVPAEAAAVTEPLIQALAQAPPAEGWLTLAMQPPPPGEGSAAEFCARLTASLAHLKNQGELPIVLAGVGRNFAASLACHARKLPIEIVAVVGIGRWQGGLTGLDMPVFDLIPSIDREAQKAARGRAVSAEKRPPMTYLQFAVDAQDERFVGAEEEVAKRLRGWLGQLPPSPRRVSR